MGFKNPEVVRTQPEEMTRRKQTESSYLRRHAEDFAKARSIISDYIDGLEAVKREKEENDEIYNAPQPDPKGLATLNARPLSFLYNIESPLQSPAEQNRRRSGFGNLPLSPIQQENDDFQEQEHRRKTDALQHQLIRDLPLAEIVEQSAE